MTERTKYLRINPISFFVEDMDFITGSKLKTNQRVSKYHLILYTLRYSLAKNNQKHQIYIGNGTHF